MLERAIFVKQVTVEDGDQEILTWIYILWVVYRANIAC